MSFSRYSPSLPHCLPIVKPWYNQSMKIKEPIVLSVLSSIVYILAGIAGVSLISNLPLGVLFIISGILGSVSALKGYHFLEYVSSLFVMCGASLLIVLQLETLTHPLADSVLLISFIIMLVSRNIAIYPHIMPQDPEIAIYKSYLDEAYSERS